MLYIYHKETFDYSKNKVTENVEAAFRLIEVRGSDLDRKLIEEIEGGQYLDSASFIDKFGLRVSISELSTGCKCALYVANRPAEFVDTVECGNNARDAIIRNIKDGHILLEWNDLSIFYPGYEDFAVDVCVEGKYRFTSLDRFNYYLEHEFAACSPVDMTVPGVELCTNS